MNCVKEEYQVSCWKCLHNDAAASISRRRSVEFIATAVWRPSALRDKSKDPADSEYRRQLYMFRKLSGNPQECSMTSGPGPQGAHSNGSTFSFVTGNRLTTRGVEITGAAASKLIGRRSRMVANLVDRSAVGPSMTRRPVRRAQMKHS